MDKPFDMSELEKLFTDEHVAKSPQGVEGHRARVRESIDRNPDFAGFADYELLEYLLFATIPRGDTKPLAKELIRIFGSLSAVFHADYYELVRVNGVGERTAHMLANVLKIVTRAEYSRFEQSCKLTTAAETARYMYARFLGRTKETLIMTSLNINDEVIQTDDIAIGGVDSAEFDLVKILRCADRNGAKKILLAHNHPGGTLDFSVADIESTARVITCCELTGYVFLDHLVFVGNKYISMFSKDKLSQTLDACGKQYSEIKSMLTREQTRRSRLAAISETAVAENEYEYKMRVLDMYREIVKLGNRERSEIMERLTAKIEL